MGKIGEEITQKIKSAVKAKLIELGVEVDNELPDYIMVLVANKKTQSQMEKDLQLFLGPNTVLFTTWLLNVLKKLEEVTVSKKNYKKIEVTNQEGSLVVTKSEEDLDRRQDLKKPVRVKVEPGTAEPEANTAYLEISTAKDITTEEDGSDLRVSVEQDSNSSEDEDVEQPQSRNANSSDKDNSPSQSLENISNDEDAVLDKSPHSGKSANENEDENTEPHQKPVGAESNFQENESDDNPIKSSGRPKIIYGIREQIDEVMEKTINGNRRPREERGKSFDEDNRKISNDDYRRSLENDFYGKKRSRSGDRSRDDRGKSHDSFDKGHSSRGKSPAMRKRMYSDRRSPDFSRRSPLHRRGVSDFSRRSPDIRQRSPDNRRRSPYSRRRSPDDRRRSPFDRRRSPDDRRRSPFDRRRSPFDRRRSPIIRRRSPDDRRRPFEDRGRRDDLRRSPDNRSKLKVLDAREILKRKTSKDNDTHLDYSTSEDSHRSEKRRKVVSSFVHKPEGEREKSVEPQIPSLVRVTPRPLRKEAIQPNKKLLLLAVADAEKSVSRPHNKRQERHSPAPSSSRKREISKTDDRKATIDAHNSNSGYIPPEKIFITLTNNQKSPKDLESSGKGGVSREVSARKLYDDNDLTLEEELLYEEQYFDYEQDDLEEVYSAEHQDEYVPLPIKDKKSQTTKPNLSSEAKCIISLESSPERSCDEWEELNSGSKKRELTKLDLEKVKVSTLDNLETSVAERLEDSFEWNRLGLAPVATVKPLAQGSEKVDRFKGEAVNKALERCKFWPDCLSGTCIYYHPSSSCKLFPLCKSGKECLFIHPDCKFGTACLNPKCTFLHKPYENKKVDAPVSVLSVSSLKPSRPVVKCTYFPNCKNLSCKFWHPVKNCKYGRTCARSDCYFFHPTLVIPPKDLLTWTAKL